MTRAIVILVCFLLTACGGGGGSSSTPAPPAASTPAPAPTPAIPLSGVVFIGDSLMVGMMNFSPNDSYKSAAISGQTSVQMLARFQTDVLDKHPAAVVILAGENDVLRTPDPNTDSIARMADLAQHSGAKVVICLIPPVEDWDPSNLITDPVVGRAGFARFNQALKDLAAGFGYTIADIRTPLTLFNGSQNPALFTPDGGHPNLDGIHVEWSVITPLLQGL